MNYVQLMRKLSVSNRNYGNYEGGSFARDFRTELSQDRVSSQKELRNNSINTNDSSNANYLNYMDIKKRAIQIFHTEDSGLPFGVRTSHRGCNRFILHPNGRTRSFFDFATSVWVLLLVFWIPFDVGFVWNRPSNLRILFMDLLDIWFAIDIILNFRTGYIYNGTIVMKPDKIVRHYASTWFLIDLFGTIPFEKFLSKETKSRKSLKLIKYVKIPKLMRVTRLMRYIQVQKNVYDIFQMIFLIFTLLHFGACVWMNTLDPCEDEIGSLVENEMCDQSNVWRAYAEAVHLSTVMMLGVSNVHIIGGSDMLELMMEARGTDKTRFYIVSTFFMVGGLFVIALLISEMSSYIMGKSQGSAAFQRRSDRVKHEMEYYRLPHDLQLQVKAYYNYVWIHQKQYDDRIALLSDHQMSTDLQRKVALHLFKDVISHVSFFSDIDDMLLGEICLSLRSRIFLPDDMIIYKGDVGKELFIIAKGVVEVLRDDLPTKARERTHPILLRNGSFFGEIALVMEVRRTCSVQARTVCEVSILLQKSFDAILSEHPAFGRRMNELVVARQLDKHLAKSVNSGQNCQVSKKDLDTAYTQVEKNMKEGLQRRMESTRVDHVERSKSMLNIVSAIDQKKMPLPWNSENDIECNDEENNIDKNLTNRESMMSCVTLSPGLRKKRQTQKQKSEKLKKSTSMNVVHPIVDNNDHEIFTVPSEIGCEVTIESKDPSKLFDRRKRSFSHPIKSRISQFWNGSSEKEVVPPPNQREKKQEGHGSPRKTRQWQRVLSRMSEEESSIGSNRESMEEEAETLMVVGGYSPRNSVVDINKVRPSILRSCDVSTEQKLKCEPIQEFHDEEIQQMKHLEARLSSQDEAIREVLMKLEILNDVRKESKSANPVEDIGRNSSRSPER